jgi:subtilase family serine protease
MDPLVLDKVSFELSAKYPDLIFVDGFQFYDPTGESISEPTSKGNYTLLFAIANMGNTTSAATDVITIIDDERIIRSILDPLEPGSRKEIVISFPLVEGSHTIWIEIDPQNNVHELNDQVVDGGMYDNNQKTLMVEIDKEEEALPVGAIALGLTFAILAMVVILFVLLFIWRRPRSHPEEE